MTLLADILARIAYEETVNDIKKRNNDFIPPSFDEVMKDEGAIEFTEACATSVKCYLENRYSK